MSEAVQITLIICVTIIILYMIDGHNSNNVGRGKVGRCKQPTYPKPPIPGSTIYKVYPDENDM